MRERNQQARAVHKAQIHGENAVVPHVHATEVLYPGDRALDFPAFAVAPQLAFVFVLPQDAIAAVGGNQVDAATTESQPHRVAVVAPIRDHATWLAARTPATARGTRIVAQAGSATRCSDGLAEVPYTPSGVPCRSTIRTSFIPFPRRVWPTASPLFWPAGTWRPERPRPSRGVPAAPVGAAVDALLSQTSSACARRKRRQQVTPLR